MTALATTIVVLALVLAVWNGVRFAIERNADKLVIAGLALCLIVSQLTILAVPR